MTRPFPLPRLEVEEPEMTISKEVKVKGSLTFLRYLRIDGEFEGELISEGKLFVGPHGKVQSDLHLSEAIIEGEVTGEIVVTGRLELRGQAKVFGNIKSGTLSVDEGVTLVGQVTVQPPVQES